MTHDTHFNIQLSLSHRNTSSYLYENLHRHNSLLGFLTLTPISTLTSTLNQVAPCCKSSPSLKEEWIFWSPVFGPTHAHAYAHGGALHARHLVDVWEQNTSVGKDNVTKRQILIFSFICLGQNANLTPRCIYLTGGLRTFLKATSKCTVV